MLLCVILIISFFINGESALPPTKDSKIVGGSPINIDVAKYQISLRVKAREKSKGFGSGHICGGSVIAQRSILTAAHCVQKYKAEDLRVLMGNSNRIVPEKHQLQYNVQQILIHESYNDSSLMNDIALLFVDGYIPWNWPTVQAIQLNTQQTAGNSLCNISGWGDVGNGELSTRLLGATVAVVSYQQCSNSYGFLVPLTMICAGYMNVGGIDACKGDSGGPFVCNGLLSGVVSWGEGCALPDRPGVYTNASAFHGWIVKANNSFNYSFYGSSTDLSLNIFLIVLLAIRFLYLLQ